MLDMLLSMFVHLAQQSYVNSQSYEVYFSTWTMDHVLFGLCLKFVRAVTCCSRPLTCAWVLEFGDEKGKSIWIGFRVLQSFPLLYKGWRKYL